jgi:hypothetical protein
MLKAQQESRAPRKPFSSSIKSTIETVFVLDLPALETPSNFVLSNCQRARNYGGKNWPRGEALNEKSDF